MITSRSILLGQIERRCYVTFERTAMEIKGAESCPPKSLERLRYKEPKSDCAAAPSMAALSGISVQFPSRWPPRKSVTPSHSGDCEPP